MACPICDEYIQSICMDSRKNYMSYYEFCHQHDNRTYTLRIYEDRVYEAIEVMKNNSSHSLERETWNDKIEYTYSKNWSCTTIGDLNLDYNRIAKLADDKFIKKISNIFILS